VKKLINNPESVVEEMLAGVVAAHPAEVRKLPDANVIVRKNSPVAGKVALVSGGGSGHEPAHGGYVGEGMLDAAVAGAVFTSPTPDQVYEAVKAVDSGKGTLLVVKNYTGDIMNFDMAAEMAQADGIQVASIVVNDDGGNLNAVSLGHFGGHVKVHDVAGVVLDHQQGTLTGIDGLDGLVHLIRRGRGEYRAGHGRVQHAFTHVAAVGRLVTAATARDQSDLAGHRAVLAHNHVGVGQLTHLGGMGRHHAGQHFLHDGLGVVDELLHTNSSPSI